MQTGQLEMAGEPKDLHQVVPFRLLVSLLSVLFSPISMNTAGGSGTECKTAERF
jgi:hypothetical protein